MAAASTALGSLLYVLGDPESFSQFFREKYLRHLLLVRIHGVTASLTLLLGPVQWLRSRDRIHGWLGRLYLTNVLVGGLTGLALGTIALGGLIAQSGFCLMAILWLYTGWKALMTARSGKFEQHRIWVVRNFALACGAITLRLYLNLTYWLQVDYREAYPPSVWACWGVSMLVGEMVIATNHQRLAGGPNVRPLD